MEDDEGKECDTGIGNKSLQGRLNSGEEDEGEDEDEEGGRRRRRGREGSETKEIGGNMKHSNHEDSCFFSRDILFLSFFIYSIYTTDFTVGL